MQLNKITNELLTTPAIMLINILAFTLLLMLRSCIITTLAIKLLIILWVNYRLFHELAIDQAIGKLSTIQMINYLLW